MRLQCRKTYSCSRQSVQLLSHPTCRHSVTRPHLSLPLSSPWQRFGKAAEAGEDVPVPSRSASVSGDWEQLTEQTVTWDLMLHQLSDVTALCDVIPAAHRSDVTLRALLKKGPGG